MVSLCATPIQTWKVSPLPSFSEWLTDGFLVFRLRLGKALNYEFNEDSQTGLFQRRDPREGGPALDIERGELEVFLPSKDSAYSSSPTNPISPQQTREGCPPHERQAT